MASLIFSDRRYGWVVVGILAGILLSLGFKTSMKLDLIQVKEKATDKYLSIDKKPLSWT